MKLNKKWLMLVSIQFVIGLIISLCISANENLSSLCGIVYIVYTLFFTTRIIQAKLAFSPFTPCLIFDFSIGLYMLHLVTGYDPLPLITNIIIFLCSFLWKAITTGSWGIKSHHLVRDSFQIKPISKNRFKRKIVPLFLIAVICIIYEWRNAGGIPAFRSDSESFRFSVGSTSYIHFLAIMNKIVCMLIGIYLLSLSKIRIIKDFWLITMAIISELLMCFTAMRGEMLFAPCIIFIAYGLTRRIKKRHIYLISLLGILLIGILPFYRMYKLFGVAYVYDIQKISVYPKFYILTPLYQTLANNLKIFSMDIKMIPDQIPWGLGEYSILTQIPFVDLGKSFYALQNIYLGGTSELTGTYLQTWYADFGYLGCIAFTILLSWYCNTIYGYFLRKKSLFSAVWYSYTLYNALWMFYANTFDIVYILYMIIIYFVINTSFKTD